MSEILSQSEIDSLLNALSAGEYDADDYKEQDEKMVKNYDFARPSKFSKEHLRTLEIIFEHYGRLLATHLPGYLRKNVQVEVVNSEAVVYSEFSNALSNPVMLGIINFAPLNGNIIIEWASNLVYTMIDRMLGGEGEPLEKNREFSEIELVIFERIFNVCVKLLVEPWQSVTEISPKLEKMETNSQFAQIVSPSEMIAIISMNVKIGDIEGLMNVCLPYICLEPIMDRLNTKYWFSTMQENNGEYEELMEALINKAYIPVSVILGRSTINVNDFINLQVGDIIRLDTKIDDELSIYTGNIKKFEGLPGLASEKHAVRVTSIIREEQ